jgi:hypothetical protein
MLLAQAAFGQPIVVPNDNVRLSPFLNDHLLNVGLSPSSNVSVCGDLVCSYVVFEYENGVLDFGADHQFATISGDWYLVSAGDIFSEATIDQYPAMFLQGRLVGPPVEVGTSDFYLGVRLDISDAYGWVRLSPIDGMITMLANAIAYRSRGIVVGTLHTVPEPSSAGLTIVGLLPFMQFCIGRTTRRP